MVERYINKINKEVEPQLIERLSQHDFICGDTFSAADCIMGHNVMWAKSYGLCNDESIKGYLSRISKRPAFMAAFADAKQFVATPPDDSDLKSQVTG